jgi:hypothetical protein
MGYSRRLTPPPARDLPERPDHPDLDTLQALATESAARWSTWSTRSPSQDEDRNELRMRAAATILTQLVMHGRGALEPTSGRSSAPTASKPA